MRRILTLGVFVILLVLAGCGSGGGEGGGITGIEPGTESGSDSGPEPDETDSATYKALTPAMSASDFISQANAEGATGYRFLSNYIFGGFMSSIYVKDNLKSFVFSYKVLTPATSVSGFIAQANTEGVNGFCFLGTYSFSGSAYALYVKDISESSTFSFKALTPATSASGFIEQANGEGMNGYRYLATYIFSGTVSALYVKDTSQVAFLNYKALTPATSVSGFIAQVNVEGANGYRFFGEYSFSGAVYSLYVKDISQSSTFSYENLTLATSSSEFITQANEEGAKGYRFLGGHIIGGSSFTLYIDLTHSSGILSSSYLSQGGIPY